MSPQVKKRRKKGPDRFYGVSRLAKELGVHPGTVSRKMGKGMTEAQIRADADTRKRQIAVGEVVRGRVTGTRLDPSSGRVREVAPVASPFVAKEYVPALGLRVRKGGRVGTAVEEQTDTNSRVAIVGERSTIGTRDGIGWTGADRPGAVTDGRTGETKIQAELRKEVALASLRELELRQKSGELVDVGHVNAWMGTCIVAARNALLRVGPELRDRLAAETDPVRIEGLINGEVERALGMLKLLDRPVGVTGDGDGERAA